MFQGSKHVPEDTHFKLLEAAGASDINGTTDFDRTNYFETLPSNQLELALWLESIAWATCSTSSIETVARQPAGRRAQRAPAERREHAVRARRRSDRAAAVPEGPPVLRRRHRLARGHPGGEARGRAEASSSEYYAPNNASLAIVGDFDAAQTQALVEKYFGSLKRGPPVPPITAHDAADHRRAPQDRAVARRAAARLHGVAHAADLQAGRRRGRHRRARSWAAAGRAGSTRSSSTRSRSRRTSSA